MVYDKQLILPQGYTFRPLQKSDYHNNFKETLEVLTEVGNVTEAQFYDLFEYWQSNLNYHPYVITNTANKVVATGMVFFERKMIHECATYAHIEDIAVSKSEQGNKLGYSLIVGLTNIAKEAGCHKILLDCSPENEGFYEKCGYGKAGSNMNIKFG